MKDVFRHIEKMADVFFNGAAGEPISKVTVQELVKRRESIVRVGCKLYRITVKEVEITK